MYLCDRDLRALLPELDFRAEAGAEVFTEAEQVQPASVDLRLGTVFWRPIKRFTLDLRKTKLLEIEPRRYYRRSVLGAGESIVLKPGELLLARTLEEFTIPNGHAAELTGRSSFARLGLMVSSTGGFINPGWRGRMPLQLVNFSPNPIRLFSGLPICQIRILRLSGLSERAYGHPTLDSKYMNDDGGPSYWWRDKRITKLHQVLSEKCVAQRIQKQIDEIIGQTEPEIIERLENLVTKMKLSELENADSLLDRFAEAEDGRRTRRQWAILLSRGSFTVGITASLWVANKPPIKWWHFLVWGIGLLLVCLSIYAFRTEVGDHLGAKELRARKRTT
jgi:deoxycytidine triphosphate deaminase